MKGTILTVLGLLLLTAPIAMQAQFTYETNDGSITITGYDGPGGSVVIPATINGLNVTSIGNGAFDAANLTSVTIPAGVASIGQFAFYFCTNLVSVTMSSNIASIRGYAFQNCASLAGIYFYGNAPNLASSVFGGDANATAYYVAGTAGWGTSWGGLPTALWNPQAQGSLEVTINPSAAITQGAQWQVDGETFQNSGTTLTNLPAGNHTVSFSAISSWTTPANQTITIASNATTNAIGTYVRQAGSLQVTIAPALAVSAGAQWQVDAGAWQNSAATVTNLSVGAHALSFKSISLWNTPSNQSVMITNAELTPAAGFYTLVEKGNPTLTIAAPKPRQAVSNADFTVTGSARDKEAEAVESVYYQLNGGSWTPATTTNLWSNWSASVTLSPGTNTINAYAVNTSGHVSPANKVAFQYIPSAVLIVVTNGIGIVTPDDNGKLRALGANYTLTAMPGRNWIFSNWVGGTMTPYAVLGANASYKFPMQSNLVLEANFVTNFFLAAKGTYNGLFAPANAPRQQTNSGAFTINVTSGGLVTGDLYLSSTTIPLNGKFNVSGTAQVLSPRVGRNTLTTVLQLNLAGQSVQGTVSDGSFTAILNGDQAVFNTSHRATNYEGQYTVVIFGTNDPTIGPFGASFGTATVDASGRVTFAGSLADGTTVSRSSVVSKDGAWPFYLPLYSGHGSIYGWNCFPGSVTNGAILFATNASWINAANSARNAIYSTGFTNLDMPILGSTYKSAAAPLLALTNGNGEVLLEGGDLAANMTNFITVASNNKITLTTNAGNTDKLMLTINKTAGTISGSFVNPARPEQTILVHGAILQGQTNAAGYFLGSNASGAFTLGPPQSY
jgi:hypothetical protein